MINVQTENRTCKLFWTGKKWIDTAGHLWVFDDNLLTFRSPNHAGVISRDWKSVGGLTSDSNFDMYRLEQAKIKAQKKHAAQ